MLWTNGGAVVTPDRVAEAPGEKDQSAEYNEAVGNCPTPGYHETHRYCPSCPWTERGPLESIPKQCDIRGCVGVATTKW